MRSSPSWSTRATRVRASGSSTTQGSRRTVRASATLLATGGAGPGLSRDDQSRRWRPATASRWRTMPARASPIWSSCSFIPTALNKAGRAALPDLRSAARRGRAAGERAPASRSWPAITRTAISRRATSSRGASCARPSETGGAGVPDPGPPGRRARPRARFPTIAAMCAQVGHRHRHRSHSGRPGRALPDGRHRHRRVGADVAARACTPPARPPAPACTAPTAWPATRCSKGSSSAPAPASVDDRDAPSRPSVRARSRGRGRVPDVDRAAALEPSARWTPTRIRDLMWRSAGLFRSRDAPAGRRAPISNVPRCDRRRLSRGRAPRPRRGAGSTC